MGSAKVGQLGEALTFDFFLSDDSPHRCS